MSWTTKHSDKPSDLKRESILTLPLLELFPRKPSIFMFLSRVHTFKIQRKTDV